MYIVTENDTSQLFWSKVDIQEQNACWEWKGYCMPDGRGSFHPHCGVKVLAHRFAYEDRVGSIPIGLKVCHHCDNPKCCNPSHLFIGTQSDNIVDMCIKGRGRYYNSTLTKCKHGHEFTPENTEYRPNGKRRCRACNRAYYYKRKDIVNASINT